MLVDASVWVDHLRRNNSTLVSLLEQTQVWTHAFVVGGLACGNLAQQDKVLGALMALPSLELAQEIGGLRQRAAVSSRVTAALLGLAALSMALFRYSYLL